MKNYLLLWLLLLVGCTSKPKPVLVWNFYPSTHVSQEQWYATQMLYPSHLDNNGDPLVDPRDGQGLEPDIYDNTVQPCEKGTHWEIGWDQYGEYWGCAKNTSQDDNYMIRFPESLPEAALTSAEQLLVCGHGLCTWESYCDHAKKGQECVQRRKP